MSELPKEFESDYEPTLIDIMWAKTMVNLIADGGLMIFPSTNLIYEVRQELKVLELVNIEILNTDPRNRELHGRSHNVFEMIGWKVIP